MSIGEKLEEKLREASQESDTQWSLHRLHRDTGIAESYLYKVKHGQTLPSPAKLRVIAETLDVDVGDLIVERDTDELEALGFDRETARLAVELKYLDHEEKERLVSAIADFLSRPTSRRHSN